MLNKQNLMILVNKFIGQIKSLFSRFSNKKPKEIISQILNRIIFYKNIIKPFIQKLINQIKSCKFSTFIEQIKSFKFKLLLERFSKKKTIEIIPNGVLGININNNSIVIVHVVMNGLQDIAVKSRGIFALDSIDINLQREEQRSSIENIIVKYIHDNNLSLIIGSYVLSYQQYVLSLIELPSAKDAAQKEKAILWSVKDSINYSIDDAILESFEVPVNRTQDNAKLAYAVAMRAKLSEEIGKLLNKCGVNLKYIDINELCIRNIMALYPDMQQGCLVLKISDSHSNILLIKNNALFISRSTKLNIKQLDNFDPNKNDEPEKLNIAENLILELQRSLDYGNSIFRDLHFSSICILPYAFNLDLFIVWAKEQLGLPIFKIDLSQKIKFEQNISQNEQAEYVLAIGAALRDIDSVSAN